MTPYTRSITAITPDNADFSKVSQVCGHGHTKLHEMGWLINKHKHEMEWNIC